MSDLLTHYIGPYHHLNKKMVRWGKSPTVLKKPLKKKKVAGDNAAFVGGITQSYATPFCWAEVRSNPDVFQGSFLA